MGYSKKGYAIVGVACCCLSLLVVALLHCTAILSMELICVLDFFKL